MSHEGVELAREAIAAYNRREVAALAEMVTEDCEWTTVTGGAVDSTVYRGPEGVARYFEEAQAIWEGITLEPSDFRELGDRVLVVATLRARGRGSGVDLETPWFGVFASRDSRIAQMLSFTSEAAALEAASGAGRPGT